MSNFTPGQTGFSRVFVIEGRAGPDNEPDFQSCMKSMGIDKAYGDVEKIECPDPDRYDDFDEIGEIVGSDERMTTSLVGRYAADVRSTLLRLAQKKCNVDAQVHFGACTNPSDFNSFTKALVYEQVRITNYGTEDLGALGSDERSKIDETGDISVKEFYEVLPLSFQRRGDDVITNQLLDGIVCDSVSCGDCDDESGGCEKFYFITGAAGGSPGTPADVVYSIDSGANVYAHDIDTLGAAEVPAAIACLGVYTVVVSNDSCSLHYVETDDIVPTDDPAWTEVTTGFVAANCPNDAWSTGTYMFAVGDNGYVYGTSDPTGGVSVLDAGIATSLDLRAVHALNNDFAVAVGDSGAIISTENQTTWSVVTPTNVLFTQNWEAVWIKSETEWWIVGATVGGVGQVWYTLNGGITFTQQTSIPGTYTDFKDIQFSTDSVGYLAGIVSGPAGRILRTYDGGYSWQVLPEGAATMPANDEITALATCLSGNIGDRANFVVGGGLADNGTDGILVLGQD